mmetsp:Transcript_6933/g.17217  ORF Transcript_6933/g.17217 Transcript_6933/m.17217 type:complete len:729 (-) Transcript_6933:380-2566(-)|eukprot:CAMPEP_0206235202 /NCGR_PEP_ID=MMETSP0047_2-20121206/13020_1 /ASSEMBLY_ACC=CAM_ASM_000192 /TAXON_ID=195065 /ORGANISM="Chroomonas mesostigmatica_cf, Strain CCMP1168" /LENGTH=728 /DNA_ID=CAMNT_0053659383 /DNA_START=36 /DNA_END=2222 /DNA_ORIENTATION=+
MKFGETMDEMCHSPWQKYYIHYNSLKQIIKRIGWITSEGDDAANFKSRSDSLTDAEEALWLSLEKQLQKTCAFVDGQVQALQDQLDNTTREIDKVKALQSSLREMGLLQDDTVVDVVDGFFGPRTQAAFQAYTKEHPNGLPLPDADAASIDMMADLCTGLDLLRYFCMLDYIALCKLVKKHAKWSRSEAIKERVRIILPQQSFFNGQQIMELVYKAEALITGDVSLGRARFAEGGAWMESRLVQSKLFAMLARSEKDVGFPPLPWTQNARDRRSSRVIAELDAQEERRKLKSEIAEELLDSALATPKKAVQAGGAAGRRASQEAWDKWNGSEEADGQTPRVFKIALTGGPCAGKTSSLSTIADHFRGIGWRVYISREAATVLLGGGINFATLGSEQVYETQKSIVQVMLTLEDAYTSICKAGEKDDKCLVICDRGVMDASVYCDQTTWKRILSDLKMDHSDVCDARYDAVLHLVTAADGAEDHYNLDSNEEGVRQETPEQARELDRKTSAAWSSHPSLIFIDNSTDFNGKLSKTLAAVCNAVGVIAPSVRVQRRKFLVSRANLARAPFPVSTSDCEYTYLRSFDGMQHRLRRRTMEGNFLYTHIRRSLGANGEYCDLKRNINRRQYLELLAHQDPDRMLIRLVRQSFVFKNRAYCLNTVLGVTPKAMHIRMSPRAFEDVKLLSVYSDHDDVELPDPSLVAVEKEVTGLLEYSLFSLSHYQQDGHRATH